jgi:hypothetical protein
MAAIDIDSATEAEDTTLAPTARGSGVTVDWVWVYGLDACRDQLRDLGVVELCDLVELTKEDLDDDDTIPCVQRRRILAATKELKDDVAFLKALQRYNYRVALINATTSLPICAKRIMLRTELQRLGDDTGADTIEGCECQPDTCVCECQQTCADVAAAGVACKVVPAGKKRWAVKG